MGAIYQNGVCYTISKEEVKPTDYVILISDNNFRVDEVDYEVEVTPVT